MIRATDFLGVVKGKYQYLFILVTDAYWLQSAGPNSFVNVLEDTFASRLGRHGAVVTSYSEYIEKNYHQVLSKNWPPEVMKVLEDPSDPKLLVISSDFEDFDPQQHRYALIDFREYRGDSKSFIEILRELEKVATSGVDLFDWWETKAAEKESMLGKVRDAAVLKPGIWGFSFDLKKFFKWQ